MNDDPGFDVLLARGLAASGDNRSEEAMELFAQAAALAPGSGLPHLLLGSEHASRGDIAAAETAFANAVLVAPEFALARYQLGLLQFSSRRAAVALLTWQPLLSLPPERSLPHLVRGFAALAQDQFDAALAHFRSGLACEEPNEALRADVRRVVQSVEELARQQQAPPDPSAQPDGGHFLLSGYARGLH